MQLNLKDSVASALTNLAKLKNVGVETLVENLIMQEVRNNAPSGIRDTKWAVIQDGKGSVTNWQPRFDANDNEAAKKRQDELDEARACQDMARQQMIARMRGDEFPTKPQETLSAEQLMSGMSSD